MVGRCEFVTELEIIEVNVIVTEDEELNPRTCVLAKFSVINSRKAFSVLPDNIQISVFRETTVVERLGDEQGLPFPGRTLRTGYYDELSRHLEDGLTAAIYEGDSRN